MNYELGINVESLIMPGSYNYMVRIFVTVDEKAVNEKNSPGLFGDSRLCS